MGQHLNTKDKIIDLFQNEKQFNILLMNVKSGGTGLNITAAN